MRYDISSIEYIIVLLFTLVCFYGVTRSKIGYKQIVLIGLFLRVLLLVADLQFALPLPGLNGDQGMFHRIATINQDIIGEKIIVTNYSVFLTYLYSITNCSRVFAQLLNIGMSIIMVAYVQKSLYLFGIDKGTLKKATIVMCYAPYSFILSTTLLRESWVSMFVAVSLYYFILWIFNGRLSDMFRALLFVLFATYMHTGIIGVLAGYMIVYAFYDRNYNTFMISRKSLLPIIVVICIVIFIFAFPQLFLSKLMVEDTLEGSVISRATMNNEGGSEYLTWLPVDNLWYLLLFSPLKMFYFLFSPVPWEWRNVMDAIAFIADAFIWVYLISIIVKSQYNKYHAIKQSLIISLVGAVFVFGVAIHNSGTAIRHRSKLLSIIVVTTCVSAYSREKQDEYMIVE